MRVTMTYTGKFPFIALGFLNWMNTDTNKCIDRQLVCVVQVYVCQSLRQGWLVNHSIGGKEHAARCTMGDVSKDDRLW